MKKYIFYLLSSTALFIGGITFFSCDDDETETPPVEVTGTKTFELSTYDENGTPVPANIMIKKGGEDLEPVFTTNGTYTLDVSEIPSKTLFEFSAASEGYIGSKAVSATLSYNATTDAFSQAISLHITKRGDPVTIDPTKDTKFEVPSTTSTGATVEVNIPAGATGSTAVTLYPTVIPTSASRGKIEVESPNNSLALQIIDLESNFTGNFADNKKVEFTFPLTQDIIDLVVNQGIDLLFTSDSHGTLESYPIAVNAAEKTGTVSIPHFSTWYVSTGLTVNVTTVPVTEVATLGFCSQGVSYDFERLNGNLPETFERLYNRTTIPPMSGHVEETGVNNQAIRVLALYNRITLSTTLSTGATVTYTFFDDLVLSPTLEDCGTHNGGTGGN